MATRVVSEVQKINSAIADVYAFLSDFSKIGKLIETARQMGAGNQMPELADKIEDVRTTVDACTFMVKGVGEMGMKIVEREEPKCIKFATTNSPIAANLWIQVVPEGDEACKMRLTIKADINPFIKGMVSKPLQEGLEKIADVLAMIPYNS